VMNRCDLVPSSGFLHRSPLRILRMSTIYSLSMHLQLVIRADLSLALPGFSSLHGLFPPTNAPKPPQIHPRDHSLSSAQRNFRDYGPVRDKRRRQRSSLQNEWVSDVATGLSFESFSLFHLFLTSFP